MRYGRGSYPPLVSAVLLSVFATVGALLWAGALGTLPALVVACALLVRCVVDSPRNQIRPASARAAIATACAFATVAAVQAYGLDSLALADAALARLGAWLEWSLSLAPFDVRESLDFFDDWDGPRGGRAVRFDGRAASPGL